MDVILSITSILCKPHLINLVLMPRNQGFSFGNAGWHAMNVSALSHSRLGLADAVTFRTQYPDHSSLDQSVPSPTFPRSFRFSDVPSLDPPEVGGLHVAKTPPTTNSPICVRMHDARNGTHAASTTATTSKVP